MSWYESLITGQTPEEAMTDQEGMSNVENHGRNLAHLLEALKESEGSS